MITAIGWILWALAALNALCWLVISLASGDPGGRWLYRVQALIWLVGCAVTWTLPISKLHILWIYPLGAMAPYAIMQWRMQRQMDTGTSPFALYVKGHLEVQSGGEVWSWPEMRRVFKVYEATSPKEWAKQISGPELAGWWLTKEPGVGVVKVIRRVDKVRGTLYYKDRPRFYFGWRPD